MKKMSEYFNRKRDYGFVHLISAYFRYNFSDTYVYIIR